MIPTDFIKQRQSGDTSRKNCDGQSGLSGHFFEYFGLPWSVSIHTHLHYTALSSEGQTGEASEYSESNDVP